MRLDVFLEGDAFDRDAVEAALAANGIAGDGAALTTADGGSAAITLEDDSCGFLVERLTLDVARIVFDVARRATLAILPVDASPVALVVVGAQAPEDLDARRVRSPRDVHEALTQSVARLEEARGARSA